MLEEVSVPPGTRRLACCPYGQHGYRPRSPCQRDSGIPLPRQGGGLILLLEVFDRAVGTGCAPSLLTPNEQSVLSRAPPSDLVLALTEGVSLRSTSYRKSPHGRQQAVLLALSPYVVA